MSGRSLYRFASDSQMAQRQRAGGSAQCEVMALHCKYSRRRSVFLRPCERTLDVPGCGRRQRGPAGNVERLWLSVLRRGIEL